MSGISLDEEAMHLLKFQKAYEANARFFRAIGERHETSAIDQYAKATHGVGSRLSVVDTVLSDLITQITAAQVSAARARGSSKTPIQRDAAARDLEGIRDTIFADMTTSFGGSFLFSGADSTTAPYSRPPGGPVSPYAGSPVEMEVDIDQYRAVKVALDGRQIAQGADPQDIFAELDSLIAAVSAGDTAGIDAGMQALSRMFDRVSIVQGRVGADLRAIDEHKLRLDELKRSSAARLSALEDANMAEAITGMTQAEAAYQAALGATAAVTRMSLMDYLR